jgi:predicted kinase
MPETHRPTAFLICGLPGSGKTTLARQLERDARALRLCPDEWLAALCGPARSERLDNLRDPVEALQRDVAGRALALGINVVLENGFWSRAERDDYRAWAQALGACVELRYLDVPRDELWSRLARRNAALPAGSFHVDEHELDLWLSTFEAPTPDEVMQR